MNENCMAIIIIEPLKNKYERTTIRTIAESPH